MSSIDKLRDDAWEELKKDVDDKLERGRRLYGDESFSGPLVQTIREIKEELVDVCGWTVIAYAKMRRIEELLRFEEKEGPANQNNQPLDLAP